MEEISKITSKEISDVLDPTIAILAPLLSSKRREIQEIQFKTFTYGPTDRHKLDVYYPLECDKLARTPILFFVYGGSYTTGERNLSAKFGLVYACVGAFFARRGIVTVIADYRLAPQAQYPAAAEDVRDAMSWIVAHPEAVTSPGSPSPDLHDLVLMGHSAGAAHVATVLFAPDVLPLEPEEQLRPRITGLVLAGGGYDVSAAVAGTPRAAALGQYWGTLDEAKANDPISLFRRFPEPALKGLPGILIMQAEREPDYLAKAGEDMRVEVGRRRGVEQRMVVARGHNHISVNWVLGTGEGEDWAAQVAEWILLEPHLRS